MMLRGRAFTVRLRVAVAVAEVESVTVTEKLVVPAAVGIPVRTPAAESVNPGGKPLAVQVRGGVPPDAVSCSAVYAVPMVPAGSGEAVVTRNAVVPITIVNAAVAVCAELAASVTVTLITVVPVAVGVPLRTPPLDRLRPPGKLVALQA